MPTPPDPIEELRDQIQLLGFRIAVLEHAYPMASRLGVDRALDAVFAVTDVPFLGVYTVELGVQFNLLGSQDSVVELRVGPESPPVGVSDSARLFGQQLLGLGVTLAHTVRQTLVAWVTPGNNVQLVSSGAGSAALLSTTELVFS